MSKLMRYSIGVAAAVCLLYSGTLWATNACNNTSSECTAMCSHIYDDCGMLFIDQNGSDRTEAACITACGSTDADVVTCLTNVTCDASEVESCLLTATSTTTTTGGETTYLGGGSVQDEEGQSSSGGCPEIEAGARACQTCQDRCECLHGTHGLNNCGSLEGEDCYWYCYTPGWSDLYNY